MALLQATYDRLGKDSVITGARCTGADQDDTGVTVHLLDPEGNDLPSVRPRIAVGCDGIHSSLRTQLYPSEGPPLLSRINMCRGVPRARPFLTGAPMGRAGWVSA